MAFLIWSGSASISMMTLMYVAIKGWDGIIVIGWPNGCVSCRCLVSVATELEWRAFLGMEVV